MTHREFIGWLDYFSRVGRVGPLRLYDRGPALIAWQIDRALGHSSKLTDYLPVAQESGDEASVDEVIQSFGGVKRVK